MKSYTLIFAFDDDFNVMLYKSATRFPGKFNGIGSEIAIDQLHTRPLEEIAAEHLWNKAGIKTTPAFESDAMFAIVTHSDHRTDGDNDYDYTVYCYRLMTDALGVQERRDVDLVVINSLILAQYNDELAPMVLPLISIAIESLDSCVVMSV